MAEQLICNQQVVGSTPITSSKKVRKRCGLHMGDFPSGQRGQTVNLLSLTSVVRIHHPPPTKRALRKKCSFCWWNGIYNVDSEARRKRVAAQKQHGVLFLGRGLTLCSLSRTMRETATQFPFVA